MILGLYPFESSHPSPHLPARYRWHIQSQERLLFAPKMQESIISLRACYVLGVKHASGRVNRRTA
jgi:hypothetical protein